MRNLHIYCNSFHSTVSIFYYRLQSGSPYLAQNNLICLKIYDLLFIILFETSFNEEDTSNLVYSGRCIKLYQYCMHSKLELSLVSGAFQIPWLCEGREVLPGLDPMHTEVIHPSFGAGPNYKRHFKHINEARSSIHPLYNSTDFSGVTSGIDLINCPCLEKFTILTDKYAIYATRLYTKCQGEIISTEISTRKICKEAGEGGQLV